MAREGKFNFRASRVVLEAHVISQKDSQERRGGAEGVRKGRQTEPST